MKIILLGTKDYNWLIPSFLYLFRKYWGNDEIIYITDKPVELEIPCLQVPAYSEGMWNWHEWFSNGLTSIFEYFDNELLIIFLLDHWLNQKVDLNYVRYLSEYMLKHPNVVRGNLTAGTCYAGSGTKIDTYKGLDILTVSANHKDCSFGGGITFCPSIFNSKNMIDLLGNHWSFHQTEKLGTEKMATTNLISIGTKQVILSRTHALHHQNHNVVSFEGLNETDRNIIKEMIPDGWKIEG